MTVYLVNPPGKRGRAGRKPAVKRRKAKMATPRRNARGQFVKGSGGATRKRRTTRRRPAARASASTPRRSYRRNPPRRNILKNVTEGLGDAVGILGGEVAVGAIPGALNLPTTGTAGMVTQGLTAVGVGLVADMALPRRWAKPVLAGALAVPLRSALVQAGLPYISDALSQAPGLGRYVRPSAGIPAFVSAVNVLPATGGGSRALRSNRGARGSLGRYVPADRRLYS